MDKTINEVFDVMLVYVLLLWLLTAASIKTGRPQIARRAIELAETRLLKDSWPEYYDGTLGRYVGKQARKFQTWSIAGYLVAKMMLEDPSHLGMVIILTRAAMTPSKFKQSTPSLTLCVLIRFVGVELVAPMNRPIGSVNPRLPLNLSAITTTTR
ncbi:hypothetical protein C4D60_Mb11t14360 [Musa balbisiana]|uniref:Uncharacterized protein n=1 Tax=Musa balbisiana TaxID=52838 RepID=A0A4S8J5L0_MUSBA|nr:hypothetical protein C4D60_Mb11t14360 [Musa balbisiana]